MPEDVTSAEIARLAGVQRAAVSNWRRRHDDFPRPTGGPTSSPTFALAEVEAWLKANGKLGDNAPPRHPGERQGDLASVVAGLLPSRPPGMVLDPACGTGTVLAAAARRYGRTVAYVGQDPDRHNLDAADRALTEAGAARPDLHLGSPLTSDALARYRGAADVVVCLPPAKSSWLADESTVDLPWEFGPPSQLDSHLAWLQICYAYLKPGGTAVVPVPAPVSVRASGRRIRAEMLRAAALREVVALPEGFVPHTSVPWQVWVMGRPTDRPQYTVRLVDLDRASVPTTDDGWTSVYEDRERTREVASIELLDEDVLLAPSGHIEAPVRDVLPEYEGLRTALAKAVGALDASLPAFRRGATLPTSTVSVMDLVRLGAVAFIDKGSTPQPGDVLVPAGPDRFDATVLSEPLAQRPTGEVLRCDPDAIDPYFLACFLRSDTNRRQASGSWGGTPRLDVRRARVPRLPLTEQRQYGEAFRRLTAVTAGIADVAALANEALRTAVYGLTSGLFPPETETPKRGRKRA